MELADARGLALLLALIPALWLARRAAGRPAQHPLWFLVPPGGARGRRQGGARRARWLLVVAVGLLGLAAAGPLAREGGGARVLVIDLSATRARDVEQVRARLAGFDEVVLARPDRAPERMPARAAAPALVPGRGMVDAAGLAAAVERGLSGARTIELAAAPPPGDDVAITAVGVHRDPLRAGRARLVVELAVHGARRLPREVVARDDGGRVWGRAIPVRAGAGGFAVIDVEAAAGEGGARGARLTVALEPAGADELAIDDVAVVELPALGAAPVWIEPALRRSALAKALTALAAVPRAVELIEAPRADAIAVVTSTAWRGPARARLVISVPAAGAPVEPLLAVPGAPLPGVSAELLASTAPVAVDARAGASGVGGAGTGAADEPLDPARVWLRAGAHPALWQADDAFGPVLRLAAAIDGPALPVILADALVTPPLAPRAAPAEVVTVGEPAVLASSAASGGGGGSPAAGLPAPPAGRRQAWPLTALLLAASIAIAIEAAIGRPRGLGLALRLAVLASLALLASRGLRPPARRVAFVLDVSRSVDGDAARAALVARAGALASGDRAALVLVAGGARTVVPLGPPAAVVAFARRGAPDLVALGLEPGRSELATGLALAGTALGGAGGELVLVGDGRDTAAGASPLRASPSLIGRGFDLVPVDDGDQVRLDGPLAPLAVTPGRAIALPLIITARASLPATVTVSSRGRVLARHTLTLAAGRTSLAIPVPIPSHVGGGVEGTVHPERSAPPSEGEGGTRGVERASLAPLDIILTVPGETVAPGDHLTVPLVEPGAARAWRVTNADVAGLTPSSLPARLAAVDLLVLDDVPGPALAAAAPAITAFVEAGGTLLWAAGPEVAASGPGPLAALLPLRPPVAADDPVAVLLVVDRSGSIDAAGQAAPLPGPAELAAAAAALEPGDHFGALGFDVVPLPWLPLAPVTEGRLVPPLPDARGGTDPTAALIEAGRQLAAVPPGARRIAVLVTDGGFPAAASTATAAAAALAADGVRVEVIAAGAVDAAARARLTALATAGGGRVHDLATGLGAALPALRRGAARASGPGLARARATWTRVLGYAPAALVTGTPITDHVALSPAADAVILADVGDDPLLAARRAGAGLALAWSADLGGRWAPTALPAAVLADLARVAAASALEVSVIADPARSGELAVRVVSLADDPPSTLMVERAGQAAAAHALLPIAPGLGVARLRADRDPLILSVGATRLQVAGRDPEHAQLGIEPAVRALVRPPPIEPPSRPTRRLTLAICMIVVGILLALRTRAKTGVREKP